MLSPSSLLLGRPSISAVREFGFQGSKNPGSVTPETIDYLPDDGESHLLCVAPTGEGKGRSVIIPNLLNYDGSCIVIDPKGEAARVTAAYRRSLGQRVAILAPFDKDNAEALNPLDMLTATGDEDLTDTIDDLVTLLAAGQRSLKEPCWDDWGNGLLRGAILAICALNPPEERTLSAVRGLLMADDAVYTIAVMLDKHKDELPPLAYQELASFINHEATKVRPSVLSTAQLRLRIFAANGVIRATGPSTIDLSELMAGEPMTVYLVMPPEKLCSHGPLFRLWIGAILSALISRTRLPEKSTLLLIDECAALGTLDQLRTAITMARGYGVRCAAFFQDFSQLKLHYPNDWPTFVNNAALMTFGMRNGLMARDTAAILGLSSPEEAFQLARTDAFVVQPGTTPTVVRKIDYLGEAPFMGRATPDSMREKVKQTRKRRAQTKGR